VLQVEALARHHERGDFTCGKPELDEYIARRAGQDMRRDVATVFVLVEQGSAQILGYYTLSSLSVLLNDLPDNVTKKLPRYPAVPATLLGRLAVSVARRGQGLGEHLLMDALARAAAATAQVASMAVVVDAIDDDAKAFYERYDFRPFEAQPMRLYLPMSTVRGLPGMGVVR
jgi:predicted GNAT family N-acyltransferase